MAKGQRIDLATMKDDDTVIVSCKLLVRDAKRLQALQVQKIGEGKTSYTRSDAVQDALLSGLQALGK